MRLAPKPCDALGIATDVLRKDFDRDVAAQSCIARPIHLAHTAGANRSKNLKNAEPVACPKIQSGSGT